MTNQTNATKRQEDWTWADNLLDGSDWADWFDVDDCEFDEESGEHRYFSEAGTCIVVDQNGNVLIF